MDMQSSRFLLSPSILFCRSQLELIRVSQMNLKLTTSNENVIRIPVLPYAVEFPTEIVV